MKIVGRYKEKNIFVTDLYMKDTHGDSFVAPVGPEIEHANKDYISVYIPQMANHLFGGGRNIHVAGTEDLDYKEYFPPIIVFAWLFCPACVKDMESHGSELILVYFQDAEEDVFNAVRERVKRVDWEKRAGDFMF